MDQEYRASIVSRQLADGVIGNAIESYNTDQKHCKHGYENDFDLTLKIDHRRRTSEIDAKLEVGAKRMALALGINI